MPGGPAALAIGEGADSTGCARIGCRRGGFFFYKSFAAWGFAGASLRGVMEIEMQCSGGVLMGDG